VEDGESIVNERKVRKITESGRKNSKVFPKSGKSGKILYGAYPRALEKSEGVCYNNGERDFESL